MTRLHDSWAGSGNHHPTSVRYLPGEIDRLLVLLFGRGSAGGTEDGDFAGASVWFKQFEGVAELADGGLDDAGIATDRDISQELERVIDDVGNEVGVVATTLVSDEFLDAAFQLRIDLRFIQSIHAPRLSAEG